MSKIKPLAKRMTVSEGKVMYAVKVSQEPWAHGETAIRASISILRNGGWKNLAADLERYLIVEKIPFDNGAKRG